MEVHKHPHHVTHKKKWAEYLLEFFMLFLAVFLGFVAENVREHLAEQKRGKEYVNSFVEDLKHDTAQFKNLIIEYNTSDSITDKIFSCYDTVAHSATSTDCLTELLPYLTSFTDFIYTDRTIQQLKNAGGLRLIADKNISDSIISYDAVVRQELIHQEVLETVQAKSIEAIKAAIDFPSFTQLYSSNSHKSPTPRLLQTNKEAIDKLFNDLWVFKQGLYGQKRNIKNLKVKATKMISILEDK